MSRLYGLLSEDLTEDERLGRVAASWYAGPDFLDVPTDELSDHPQFSGDNEYPSIMQYVDEVLERIRGDATPAGDGADEDSGPLDEGPMLDEGQMLDYYEQTAEDLDAEERLGRVAAAWHGGEEFLNVPTDELSEHPQFSGDNDYPSRRQYVEETMERILDDLQGNGSEREREPGQREPGTPDEGSLRIEGEGTIKVVVARDVPEATFLEDALGKGIRQWQDRLGSSRYNQHNRRG